MVTTAGTIAVLPSESHEVWGERGRKIVAAALIWVLVVALYEFYNADLFYVFDLDAIGLQYLSKGEVEHASGVIGYNIFFVDTLAVERALGRLPGVRSAHVTLEIPNRMVVEIEERQPEIVWLRGAETYWVDADGIGFLAQTELLELPVVRDLDQAVVRPGQRVQPAAIAAVGALFEAWPDAPRVFEWSAARGLALTNERGWKIYFGDAAEMASKVAKLRALIPQLVAQNATIKFIDLGKGDPYYQ
jgi:cell division protein FtsQ